MLCCIQYVKGGKLHPTSPEVGDTGRSAYWENPVIFFATRYAHSEDQSRVEEQRGQDESHLVAIKIHGLFHHSQNRDMKASMLEKI